MRHSFLGSHIEASHLLDLDSSLLLPHKVQNISNLTYQMDRAEWVSAKEVKCASLNQAGVKT